MSRSIMALKLQVTLSKCIDCVFGHTLIGLLVGESGVVEPFFTFWAACYSQTIYKI